MRKELWMVGVVYASFGVWASYQGSSYTSVEPVVHSTKKALSNPTDHLEGFETTKTSWTFIKSNHKGISTFSDGYTTYSVYYDEEFSQAVDQLQLNEYVSVSYYIDDHGQYVLSSISVQ